MITVVKVGGSLYDLPDLKPRLLRFLADYECVHLIPGGGDAADTVRAWDATHRLGEEAAHWLAVKSLALAGSLLKTLIGEAATIVEVESWLQAHDTIPHTWSVTTDSIAAHYARSIAAKELILLKSTDVASTLDEAARHGQIDPCFPALCEGLTVRFVNLRKNA